MSEMWREAWAADLSSELAAIHLLDFAKDYEQRNRCIVKAVWLALMLHYRAGFRVDLKEPEWPVAFIDLPTGQVSWHLEQFADEWDGHTTEEKNRRCQLYIEANSNAFYSCPNCGEGIPGVMELDRIYQCDHCGHRWEGGT